VKPAAMILRSKPETIKEHFEHSAAGVATLVETTPSWLW